MKIEDIDTPELRRLALAYSDQCDKVQGHGVTAWRALVEHIAAIPSEPKVLQLVDPYEDGALRPEFLGRWQTVPLHGGDGCVIVRPLTFLQLAHFSDYKTPQVLTALHNARLTAQEAK